MFLNIDWKSQMTTTSGHISKLENYFKRLLHRKLFPKRGNQTLHESSLSGLL